MVPYPLRNGRDILAIPISTVASECAFSTSGRVLSNFRSYLSPKTVEALLCTQDWLRSRGGPILIDEEDIDNIEAIEKGNNISNFFYKS
ncbi:hypothetical protein SLEP1_g20834 [Rubroshorea leprosula]|uniref:HAT C-terminal dimerisation domain-containing protein n=1 Tax=Rubroshorea leprosula TaxID=152421 RepID=A0AAV5JA24_9ROSI|nr:hypothetical protein SLEP1_g20834 [Rubroshorea leprosula]